MLAQVACMYKCALSCYANCDFVWQPDWCSTSTSSKKFVPEVWYALGTHQAKTKRNDVHPRSHRNSKNRCNFDIAGFSRSLLSVDVLTAKLSAVLLNVPVQQHEGCTSHYQKLDQAKYNLWEAFPSINNSTLGPIGASTTAWVCTKVIWKHTVHNIRM